MKRDDYLTDLDQSAVADRIVAFSGGILSPLKIKSGYIALKFDLADNSAYSNVVTIRNSRVSFFISKTENFNQARSEGFDPKLVDSSGLSNKSKYKFEKLKVGDIDSHKQLFGDIVKDSIDTVRSRRPKGK